MNTKPVSQKFNFQNDHGTILAGRLDLPAIGKPLAYAVFAHCFSCSKDLAASRGIAAALTSQGLGVLRFDFTGLGNSEGDFANSHFQANVEDIRAAISAMSERGLTPSMLVGHSLGGAGVLHVAALYPEIKAVATIGAPYDPAHACERLNGDIKSIRRTGHGPVSIAGRTFEISAHFLDGMTAEALETRLSKLQAALLVCHSPVDQTVGIDNASQIFIQAKHPKSFLSLDHSDHLLSRAEDAAFVGQQIGTWAKRYLPLALPTQSELEGQVIVRATNRGKFQQDVIVQGHAFTADEPKTVGGLNTGPAPYDLLLSALGACTNMTIKMYADRKGLKIEDIETALNHHKIYAKDCKNCETPTGKIDEITREIKIIAPELSDEQHARLMQIADMCPVHRTLQAKVQVRTLSANQP